MKNLDITIITGLSGSGKSTAIEAYEDLGYYCVDNLPVELLPKFLELPLEEKAEISGVAFGMDLREKGFTEKYPSIFEELKQNGYEFKILFLEAQENVLIKRYSQTRRHHPLARDKDLIDAIRYEKEMLAQLRDQSDKIIDTSTTTVHGLKAAVFDFVGLSSKASGFQINVLSFGFKNGIPLNVDLIVDVRFLANPYFEPELKNLNGESKAVRDFVLTHPETRVFLEKYIDLLDYLIPLYEKEGKAYLTIGIGCTGGQHRSVVIARNVFEHIEKTIKKATLTHRDI